MGDTTECEDVDGNIMEEREGDQIRIWSWWILGRRETG